MTAWYALRSIRSSARGDETAKTGWGFVRSFSVKLLRSFCFVVQAVTAGKGLKQEHG